MSALDTTENDGVLNLTLNRPKNMNAMNEDLIREINSVIDRAETKDNLRCVVIRGSDGNFSAGGDVETMKENIGDYEPISQVKELREGAHRMISRLFDLHVPTVACIKGAAVGAGLSLALACDVVIATESAKLGAPFSKVGLVVDMGGSVTITDAVGIRKAKEILFFSKLLSAREAADIGLINEAVPSEDFDDHCEELINELASGPTIAYGLSKQLVHAGIDGDINEGLKRETNAQAIAATTKDHQEGVEAFLEQRKPEFKGE
ncbi:enoyl-CoA hydratase/isomerase family protein [Natrinema halophilum]|uniref:enoyl-CoA hydratase/isomerase family protein n=1 Tax=Natrinema halophilum TaxID=1699371 RepID=UPI001F22826B|nr:enoyl-CoA hydratase-related protein [Natrinema halophilum]UHQ96219.1 enoyl-CoA hydratase-related protein [Natrinema halophilum]